MNNSFPSKKRTDLSKRTYGHEECGRYTQVTEEDFKRISDPFATCLSTFCVGCSRYVPLKDVFWEETDESVADFRKRMADESPSLLKFWHRGLGFLPGFLVGAPIGYFLVYQSLFGDRKVDPSLQITIGLFVGLLVGGITYLGGELFLKRHYDIDFREFY